MGYSREIYEKVEKKLYRMRVKAQEDLEAKKIKLYKKIPRVKDIELLLSSTSIKAARAVINGGNARNIISQLKNNNQKLREDLNDILKKNGLPINYLELQYVCNRCHDEGFIDGKMCTCMREMLKKESCNALANISPLENSSFDSFDINYYPDNYLDSDRQSPRQRMIRVLEYCKRYSREFNQHSSNLLLVGNTGIGKTHISISIAKEVVGKGYNVIYTSVQNMISDIEKERFRTNQDSNNSHQYNFLNCDLLVIDDFGTEFSTNFSISTLYNIIDNRILLKRPTIIATTESMEELARKYNKQLVSRLMGNYIRLHFTGYDIRQKRMMEMNKNL